MDTSKWGYLWIYYHFGGGKYINRYVLIIKTLGCKLYK
ncbi:hypothetical protein KIS4809_3351 [Bacillus sp. ZZV12-4809]|nr:hypothetical protein KIS4809_3351 [Bacillus sp. ZZV12-4809]